MKRNLNEIKQSCGRDSKKVITSTVGKTKVTVTDEMIFLAAPLITILESGK